MRIGDFEMTLIYRPDEQGLAKVLREYQLESLKCVWENSEKGVVSREVHQYVNEKLDGSISRASVINFLNAMVDEGVLNYVEETGKGGYHRVYTPKFDEVGFRKYVAETMVSSLLQDFPEETKAVISQLTK